MIICGPTASGKSDVALHVARTLRGEIINADSRQVYRYMPIGTGWPPVNAIANVPHHGYGIIDPDERYSAAQFVMDTRRELRSISERGRIPLVVGGSGFYIEALTGDMPLNRPPADEELRSRLRREAAVHPAPVLHEWLSSLNRSAAAGIPAGDSYRTLRRLETVLAAAVARAEPEITQAKPRLECAVVMLEVSRTVLYDRIAARVRSMFSAGLVAEARHVRTAFPGASALTSLGYAEALAYYDGLACEAEAVALAQRRTRQYAKRQQTWFRHMRAARIVPADDSAAATETVIRIAREFFATTVNPKH